MKKLFFLLFAVTMFTACGSDDPVIPDPTPNPPTPTEWNGDWNDSSDPNFKPEVYNPIKGDWIVTKRNGKDVSDFMVYRFNSNRILSFATKKPSTGKVPQYDNGEIYQINDKAYRYKFNPNVIYKYQLSADKKSLTIIDGSTTILLTEYDNNGVWFWNGDWNDPKDKNYHPNGYNPIVGTWMMTHLHGNPSTPSYIRFNKDFTVEDSKNGVGYFDKRKYRINNIGVKEDGFVVSPTYKIPEYTYSYRIEGEILYYDVMHPHQLSSTYVRVK